MSINNTIELETVTVSEDGKNGHGPPDHAGEQGPPDHAGEQGPPDHAPAHGHAEYAWVGVSPAEIEGDTNPTLSMVTGEEYTVEWTNTTGTSHNFVVVDEDGEEVIASDGTAEEGDVETVEFTATEEMGAYYSESDPDQMGGEINVEPAPEGVFEVSDIDPAAVTVEQGEPFDVSATITNTGTGEEIQDITLFIDDTSINSQELTLGADDDETVSFEDVGTDELDPGEHTHTVSTDDDEDSGTLVVEERTEELLWHRDHEWETNPEEATNWDNYEVHDLGHEASGELMAMDIDSEDRIWYIGRGADFVAHGDEVAEVCYVDPDSGEHQVALEIDVIVGSEEVTGGNARELGGQSVAIDPNFEQNGYVYVYYHPSSENFDLVENPYDENITTMLQRVSRFEMDGDVLNPDSEAVLLEIPLQLETCCHIGGHLEFGPEGDLYITTGDDSNNVGAPDDEVNWSMTDEREGNIGGRPAPVSDAQRTSGNTADLRGSILRITPTDDGGYEIPDGNLKEWWEGETGESYDEDEFFPELYVMGLRNPFTISIDDHTGFLFVGDYGNDAGEWDPDLGTVGQATYHLFDGPGNAGHPFFKGYYPNRQYDFEAGEPGQPFWFDNLRNRSRNNTGIENIPDVTPALLWHPQSFDTYEDVAPWADMPRPGETTWPQLDEGGSADAGIAYRYSDDYGAGALDPYFEGKQFFMNPENADVIRYLTLNEDGSLEIDEFLPDNDITNAFEMDVLSNGQLVIRGMRSGIHLVEYLGDSDEPGEESPERVAPGENGLSRDPPEDATFLWDGDDATLDDWQHYSDGRDAEWIEHDDYFEVNLGTGDIQPKETMGDIHLHLEWRVPEGLEGEGQGPGNSGVFMMETYEFQVLQSYDNPTYPSGYAGSFYKFEEGGGSAPLVLPIRPPGEWNEFDIVWRGPRFEEGEVVRLPQTTLFFNGVAVQMHLDIPGPVWYDTLYDFDHEEYGHPRDDDDEFLEQVPFNLQDHGAENDEVHFRNIWYRDLPERPVEDYEHPDEIPEYDTSGGDYEEPDQIESGGVGTTGTPPEDADLLIDDELTLEPGDGDWVSDEEYGDAQFHVEYRIPEDVEGEGPERGSSGVLMMGDYEINIVDTRENPVEANEWAGAYTHQTAPHHDAVREPGEWQQLDIVWQSPRFEDGELAKPAQVTALLNGVAVQTRLRVDGPNADGGLDSYQEHGEQPLRLREDGSEVQFRNTWVRTEESDELDDGDDSIPDEAIEPGTAIELDGQTSGWVGKAPDEIEDEENPTLVLFEGEAYELGWTTGDGGFHNIAIRDEDGDIVDDLSTEVTNDPDDEQWLQFEATVEMADYVCEPHRSMMIGDIDVL